MARSSCSICCLEYLALDQIYLDENIQADEKPTSKVTQFLSFACYDNVPEHTGNWLSLSIVPSIVPNLALFHQSNGGYSRIEAFENIFGFLFSLTYIVNKHIKTPKFTHHYSIRLLC